MMYCVIVCWIAASETPRSRAASGSAGTRIWSDRVPLAVAMTSSHRGGVPRRPKGVSPNKDVSVCGSAGSGGMGGCRRFVQRLLDRGEDAFARIQVFGGGAGEQAPLHGGAGTRQPALQVAAGRGQVDAARAPVGIVLPAFDQAAALQRVEQAYQRRPFDRSEDQTSDLQSLLRRSYAVFCL